MPPQPDSARPGADSLTPASCVSCASPEHRCEGWRNAALCLLVAAACVGLYWLPTGFSQAQPDGARTAVARVLRCDDSRVGQYGIVRQGEQRIVARIEDGALAGQEVEAENLLRGDAEFDWFFRPGERALLVLNFDGMGRFVWAHVSGPYRLQSEALLAGAFALLLLLVLGWTGAKALLSFVFSALLIWKGLLPLLLAGANAYAAGLGLTVVLLGVILLLVGGVNRKGAAAFCGSLLGVLTSFLIVWLFARGFDINGMARPFAKVLAQRFPEMDLQAVFLSGVCISASGAVMDLAMDVAAALQELARSNPALGRLELARAGLRIGRAVVGTMTTTLLLAYSGGYAACMMWFMAQNVPLEILLNTGFIAAEILNTLAGSFGLVATAPLTAVVAAFLFARPRPPAQPATADQS